MMQSKLARKHHAILYAKGPIFIIAYWDISSHHHRCTEVRTNSTANRQGSYFKTLQIQIALGFLLPLWCWHTEIVAICQLEWLTEDGSGRARLWLWAVEGKQQDIKKGTTQTILVMKTDLQHQSLPSSQCKNGEFLQHMYALAYHQQMFHQHQFRATREATRCLQL